jgi:hypothetical protein
MRRRTFEEMITYFNQTVSEMDIDRKYKMTLLGIVTALLQKHDEDVAQIVRCKYCKHRGEKPIADGRYWCELHDTFMYYCSDAERGTDERTD